MSTNRNPSEYPFLLVSPKKLTVMSVFTLNIYNIYWFYKNWKAVNETENTKYRAVLRAIFSIFFIRSLFIRMGLKSASQAFGIYILIALSAKLPDPWWVVSTLSFVPLILAQKSVNAQHNADEIVNAYSTTEIVLCIVGALLWVLVLIGLALPQ